MRVAALLKSGLVLFALLSSVVTASEAPAVITPENALMLAESARLNVAFIAFELSFLLGVRISAADTSRAAIWDLQSGELLLEFSQSQVGRVIGISPDRTLFAIYTALRTVEIWSVDPLEKVTDICALERTEFPRAVFCPDQRLLAVVNRWNDIEIWDLERKERLHNLTGHTSNMFSLAFSPDGQLLASGGGTSSRTDEGESFIAVWDVSTGTRIAKLLTADVGDNHEITFTLDGTRLISTGNFRLLVWDTSTWDRIHDSGHTYPGSYGIALSPDGSLLAIATDARRIRLIDVNEMRTVRDIYTGAEVLDVDFSEDGTKLAGSFVDETVRIWEIP